VQTDSVRPGTRLAKRYRLEERLTDGEGTSYWRATDELLLRQVGVRTIEGASPRVEEVAAAARSAALVLDSRFSRVLDVNDEDGLVYVVDEWIAGTDLASLLRMSGPLPPAEARLISLDVAQALASAHAQDLHHLVLRPECVVRTDSGGVKILGLGLDAVLANGSLPSGARRDGPLVNDIAVEMDTRGAGAILYAGLTARWPQGQAPSAVPDAPLEHGRLCSPRQVLAGVPAALDDVSDRVLGASPRHGDRLSTPGELARALAAASVPSSAPPAAAFTPPAPPGNAPGGKPPVPPRREPERAGRTTRLARYIAAALLICGAGLVAAQLVATAMDDEETPAVTQSAAPDAPAAGTAPGEESTVPIEDIIDFDPGGEGEENRDQVALAIDGDADTAWTTSSYKRRPDLGGLKPGVGLVLDLGLVTSVRAVTVDLVGSGTNLELRAADQQGTTADDYVAVASATDARREVVLEPDDAIEARYLLLWLTSLPPDGSDYRGGISEVTVSS
jgi:putative peptidoglycan lipid II flippase